MKKHNFIVYKNYIKFLTFSHKNNQYSSL